MIHDRAELFRRFLIQHVSHILVSSQKKKKKKSTTSSPPKLVPYLACSCPETEISESNLALSLIEQLDGSPTNSQLASLLDLGLEDDLAALAPHLGDEDLARFHGASEADLDVLVRAKRLVDGLAGDAKGGEAVENRFLEAAHLGEGGVNVKGAYYFNS